VDIGGDESVYAGNLGKEKERLVRRGLRYRSRGVLVVVWCESVGCI